MFGNEEEEQSDSTQAATRNKRNEVRRCTTIDEPWRFAPDSIEKKFCCRVLHRTFTIHAQLFNTPSPSGLLRCKLDSIGTANYSEVLHAQSISPVARHVGVACLCGTGVCRVGHAVPGIP